MNLKTINRERDWLKEGKKEGMNSGLTKISRMRLVIQWQNLKGPKFSMFVPMPVSSMKKQNVK
jgi:hypothetical protein